MERTNATSQLGAQAAVEIRHAAAASEALRDADGTVYPGWKTVLASAVGLTFGPSCLLVFCFGTFIPSLEREFGWGIGAISFGATLVTLMIIVTSLLAGRLVDRFGARRLVLWSIPLFGAGFASLALLPDDVRVFYAALALIALAAVGVWPIAYNQATALWFDRRLGLSLGLANLGIGLGAALLPALAVALFPLVGWRGAYAVLGAIAIVIPWPVCWFLLKERERASPAGSREAPAKAGMPFSQACRTGAFWLLMGGFVTLGAASSGVVVHAVRILIDAGLTGPQAAAMQSILGISLIVGRVCTGWLLDHVPSWLVNVAICLCATLGLALLAAGVPSGTAPVSAVLIGFVVGAEFDVLGYLVPRHFGRRAFGMIYAAIFSGFQFAAAISVGALGWWRQTSGAYSAGLYAIALLLVLGAVCFLVLGRARTAVALQPV